MTTSTFRVGGGYTTFTYGNKILANVQMVSERAPQPVAQPQPIQPLDNQYPIEIALPAALNAGILEITFLETWNAEVWAQLGGKFVDAADLLGVFAAQLNANEIIISKTITSPTGVVRRVTYHGCTVINAQIDELIQIGTMTIPKTMTIMYKQRTESFPGS